MKTGEKGLIKLGDDNKEVTLDKLIYIYNIMFEDTKRFYSEYYIEDSEEIAELFEYYIKPAVKNSLEQYYKDTGSNQTIIYDNISKQTYKYRYSQDLQNEYVDSNPFFWSWGGTNERNKVFESYIKPAVRESLKEYLKDSGRDPESIQYVSGGRDLYNPRCKPRNKDNKYN